MSQSLLTRQWRLTATESPTSFDTWQENIIFHFSIDAKTARFLPEGDLNTWTNAAGRGFTNDDESYTPAEGKMSAVAKKACLTLVLGCISGNAPVISPRFIKSEATSLTEIWNRLRSFYGFRQSGSRIIEFPDFTLEESESREALWERLYTFVEGNLLTSGGSVKHLGTVPTTDEEFTPTLLNILVACWLKAIHPSLPSAVRQRFPIELRDNTLFSIRNEISDSIPSILEEIEEKAGISRLSKFAKQKFSSNKSSKSGTSYKKQCCLCQAAGRPADGHFLSQCPFLPLDDQRYLNLSKTRDIAISEDFPDEDCIETQIAMSSSVIIRRVDVQSSPVLSVLASDAEEDMLLDLGAEANLATRAACERIGAKIRPTKLKAFQADGKTPLKTLGETHFSVKFSHHDLRFSALVVEELDTPLLAGVPFLCLHDILVRLRTRTIIIPGCCSFQYSDRPKIQRVNASILRLSRQTCILPGESVFLPLPAHLKQCSEVAVEPRAQAIPPNNPAWTTCQLLPVIDGMIEAENLSSDPVLISRHTQLFNVRPTTEFQTEPLPPDLPAVRSSQLSESAHMSVQVDPSGILTQSDRDKFHHLHKKYQSLFCSGIGRYNGKSGVFKHRINMSKALPPQRKGSVPMYNRKDLNALQVKCDELLAEGVFCRAEDVDIKVTHCSPSFLVKKSSGGTRLVTNFGPIADYALVPPSVTTSVEDVMRMLGQHSVIIHTDLTHGYFNIELDKESMGYVGVNTPYKGTYVYQRSVMGLPGSEAALEEILSRILGDLVQAGGVIKLVDDLYIGADSVDNVLEL